MKAAASTTTMGSVTPKAIFVDVGKVKFSDVVDWGKFPGAIIELD